MNITPILKKAKSKVWDYMVKHPGETEKINRSRSMAHVLKKHGGTPGDYKSMLTKQHGRCAICGAKSPGRGYSRFSVDDDHKTGKVRGLLCKKCNAGVGYLNDNPRLVLKAFWYLCKTEI